MHVFPNLNVHEVLNQAPKTPNITPHALPITRIIPVASPTAQSLQIETKAILPILAADLRHRPCAVVVPKRREAFQSVRAGAPAAADARPVRAPFNAVARLDKGPLEHGRCGEVADLAAAVVGGVRVDPGPREAFFEQGCVGGVGGWVGECHGSQGEKDYGDGMYG